MLLTYVSTHDLTETLHLAQETYNPFAASSDPKRLRKMKIHDPWTRHMLVELVSHKGHMDIFGVVMNGMKVSPYCRFYRLLWSREQSAEETRCFLSRRITIVDEHRTWIVSFRGGRSVSGRGFFRKLFLCKHRSLLTCFFLGMEQPWQVFAVPMIKICIGVYLLYHFGVLEAFYFPLFWRRTGW